MSLFSRVARFARSPQGKKAVQQVKEFAEKPENREKIDKLRDKVTGKDEPAKPATDPPAGA